MAVNCRFCGCEITDIAEEDEMLVMLDDMNICEDCIDSDECDLPPIADPLDDIDPDKDTMQ